jgi:uncharacterized protein (TIGR02444 family)
MEASQAEPAEASPFWRFSLRFYRVDGVAPACLLLQDEAGADVNLVLLLLWCASRGRQLSRAEIGEIDGLCAPWRASAVLPLRTLRRALKAPPPLVGAGTAEAFRGKVKAVELEAERLQQQAMYDWTQAAPRGKDSASPAAAASAMLADYGLIVGCAFPRAAMDTILAALAAAGE